MSTLLQLNTSLFSENGQSSQLSQQFVAAWRSAHANGTVIQRDLASEPVPHLTAERFGAFLAKPEERSVEQQAVVAYSDSLIAELQQADVIVLGLPLYNFGIPSTLKAYIDHIARAGVTFRYTATGPQGLLTGKKVYVFATRGGAYAGTALDNQTAYIEQFFGFLGISDVEFVYAERLAMGDDSKQAAVTAAHASITRLLETGSLAVAA